MKVPPRIGGCAIYGDPAELDPAVTRVVTIGRFDGVHAGHRALLAATRAAARAHRIDGTLAVTFWPPPEWILRPQAPPALLTTLPDRLALLAAAGLAAILVWPFDAALAAQPPEAFLRQMRDQLGMRVLVTGPNTHLGRDRVGTPDVIREICRELGVSYQVAPLQGRPEATSSSALRQALRLGDVARLNSGLGRWFSLAGAVSPGDRRGRQLGFPTANLAPPDGLIVPGDGVYVGQAILSEPPARAGPFAAAVSVGERPTFGPGVRLLEAYILDFNEDIYGRELRLFLGARIRDQQKFDRVEDLIAAMDRDVATVRSLDGPQPSDLAPFTPM